MRAAKASTKVNYGMALQQGLREDMEDYAVVVPGNLDRGEYLFAGVFDGHGGGKGADYLSKNLAKALAPAVKKATKAGSAIDETVVDAFTAFDDKLMNYLEKLPGEDWACGSTATTAMVWSDKLAIANVGDSRAVMSRGGKAVDLSSEHRPYGKSSISSREMARIKDAGGWIYDGRVCGILAVSRAFGDLEFKERGLEKMLVDGVLDGRWTKEFAKSVNFKEPPVTAAPDVLEMSIEPTDEFLIVASDGLWEVTTSSQAVIFVKRHLAKVGSDMAGLQSAADAIVEDAVKRRRTSDNVSVVIIGLPALDQATTDRKSVV